VLPLRKQFNLQTKDALIKTLVETLDKDDSDNTDHYTDNETLKGDATFEQYFGLRTKLITKIEEPAIKKQKLARIFYVLEDAIKLATLAPKSIRRPYDKKDMRSPARLNVAIVENVLIKAVSASQCKSINPHPPPFGPMHFIVNAAPKNRSNGSD